MWEISILSHQFCFEPNTYLKTKVLKQLLSTSCGVRDSLDWRLIGKNRFSCLLQLLEASLTLWVVATFHPQSSQWLVKFFLITSF